MTLLAELRSVVQRAIADKLDLYKQAYDLRGYADRKAEHHKKLIESLLGQLRSQDAQLAAQLENAYNNRELDKMLALLDKPHFQPESKPAKLIISLPSLPEPICEELALDLEELERCFNARCYRATIILCGRVLETALHRRYYELTSNDLLETAPGIGLGSLIAKLRELGVELPPGLAEQIHLINQVRIWSVHKKQHSFAPSREQTQAIVLFTLDALRKLFVSK